MHGPISENGDIYSNDASVHYHLGNLCFKFQLNQSKALLIMEDFTYIAIAYTLLCKLSYGQGLVMMSTEYNDKHGKWILALVAIFLWNAVLSNAATVLYILSLISS